MYTRVARITMGDGFATDNDAAGCGALYCPSKNHLLYFSLLLLQVSGDVSKILLILLEKLEKKSTFSNNSTSQQRAAIYYRLKSEKFTAARRENNAESDYSLFDILSSNGLMVFIHKHIPFSSPNFANSLEQSRINR